MKVGIVTLNGNENYGNVLQNFAVQEILREIGVEAETIINKTQYGHYIPKVQKIKKFSVSYMKKYVCSQLNYKYNIKNTNKGLLKAIQFYNIHREELENVKKQRRENFVAFKNNYISWSKLMLDINNPWTDEQVNLYSYYLCGSDQVWNPTYPSTSDINFLQFAPLEKRIAFSPSFGINVIPQELQSKFSTWLNEIPYLSVREEQGKKIIKELCGREAKVLCDPTMAVSRETWIKLERKPNFLKNEKYILTYFLGDRNKKYDSIIKNIADKECLEVINLFDIMDIRAYATSPQEFIYLINHASLVCTDSFHGAVFSIIMNSDFITFPRIESGCSMESRMQTLLSTFDLQYRDYRKIDEMSLFSTDFSHVASVLTKCREEVFAFLKNAIYVSMRNNKEKETNKKKFIYGSREMCCGCSACAMICPKQCIVMKEDKEGFLYPDVKNVLCVKCHKCQEVCPVIKDVPRPSFMPECFVAHSNNLQNRKESSSGGLFTEFARKVFPSDGVVYGAGFSSEFEVKHQSAYSEKDLNTLKGSKYVQSEMGSIYREVKEVLEKGKYVYFSGTPCQVKGLYTYLCKTYDNLFTQDFICHGVPSPLVWRKYIQNCQGIIQNVSFRDKKFGWHYFSLSIKSSSKKHIKRLDEDFYLKLFLDNTILRPICYKCPVKKGGSCADITLADCWESDKFCREIKDTDQGLSMVIINTEKGNRLWNQVVESKAVKFEKLMTEKALNSQRVLYECVACNPKRAIFFEALYQEKFESLVKTWYKSLLIQKIRIKENYLKTKILFCLKRIKK